MPVAAANAPFQPVFDPDNVGASLDVLRAQIPTSGRWLAGTILGETVSRRKGIGYESDGIRDYEPLDDPRQIDWGITARQADGTLQLREHYNDITPTLWIVTDAPQSRNRASVGYFTAQNLALSATLGLMRMAHQQGMPTAVLASGDYGMALNQRNPDKGRRQFVKTARTLAEATRAERDPSQELHHLADLLGYAGRRSSENIVAVVSDFREVPYPDDAEHGWQSAIERLARKGNDVIAVETTNVWNTRIPENIDRFRAANGAVIWVGNDKKGQRARQEYEAAAKVQQAAITGVLAGIKAPHITLSSERGMWRDDFCDQLRALNKRRKH